jgi:hypothetical protein
VEKHRAGKIAEGAWAADVLHLIGVVREVRVICNEGFGCTRVGGVTRGTRLDRVITPDGGRVAEGWCSRVGGYVSFYTWEDVFRPRLAPGVVGNRKA